VEVGTLGEYLVGKKAPSQQEVNVITYSLFFSGKVDKEASTVRLIRFALREYLSSRAEIFSKAHSAMSGICLTYLNSRQVKALTSDPSADMQNAPF